MRGSPEDSTGGNWVWLKDGKPGVKGSPVPRWACEKQEESSSLRGAQQFPSTQRHEALLTRRPAEGLLQPTVRKVQENNEEGSQLHTHMSKGDKRFCVLVIRGVQVHQGTNSSCLLGICNLKQSTLTTHLHCKNGELKQVYGVRVSKAVLLHNRF